MTLSPGLHTVIMAAIMASVEPQVTTTSVSGSMVRPKGLEYFRRSWAPKVMEY